MLSRDLYLGKNGALTGTRTPIYRLGGDCSVLLSYESVSPLIAE